MGTLYALLAGARAVVVALGSGYLGTALRNVRSLLTFWALVGTTTVGRFAIGCR